MKHVERILTLRVAMLALLFATAIATQDKHK